MMLERLQQLYHKELQYSHVAGLLQQFNNVLSVLQPQFMKDETGRNDAIDILCEMLQGCKTSPAAHEQTQEAQNAPN